MFTTKKAKMLAKSGVYRKWLAQKLINDVPRVAKNKWDDFDPDELLHMVGLTTYKPASTGIGGLGAFVIGAALGSVVALLLAPSPGVDLRTTVKDKAMGYLNKQNINLGQEKTAHA
ncbi:YtxH-like protein [Stigmatella aurantiaca]|uniref:YtxH-like protein n=1 Tax=Stigmatella aurantiaca TaxID=41 RepID=A0A1H7JU81_STIAU|nr:MULTISPECIES: YtxH domain-containing protein [Stigmatella]SEK78072.1 YtxH-like protein [Stigmatella aurantiaca]